MPRVTQSGRYKGRYMGGSTRTPGSGGCNISTPHSDSLNSNVFSIFGWVYPITPHEGGSSNNLIRKTAFTTAGGYYVRFLGTLSSKVNFGIFGATGESQIESDVALPKKQWSHVICEFDETGTMRIYENNDLKKSSGAGRAYIPHPSASVIMQQGLNGNQAEWGIVNRILTAEERSALYVRGEVPSGAVRFYPLDDLPANGYRDTIGGATGTGTATSYSPDVPVQMRTATDWEARSSVYSDGGSGKTIVLPALGLTTGYSFYTEIMCTGLNSSTYNKVLNINGNNVLIDLRSGRYTANGIVGPVVKLNKWNKLLFTYDGVTQKIYLEGQLVAQGATTFSPADGANANQLLGRDNAQRFIGYMKRAVIWNRALTFEEGKAVTFYNIIPYADDKSILRLNLPMNEGAGDKVYDQSGNGNDGTLSSPSTMWSAELPPPGLRAPIGGNMLKNGDFSYVPVVNVAQTTIGTWMDGTASGSSSNKLFRWVTRVVSGAQTASALFEQGGVSLDVTANTGQIQIANTLVTGSWSIASAIDGVLVEKNTEYTLRFKVKTVGITNTAGKGFYASVATGYASWSGFSATTSFIRGTNDWQTVTLKFTTHATASPQWLQTAFRMETETGKFIVKDISLLPTTPVGRVAG